MRNGLCRRGLRYFHTAKKKTIYSLRLYASTDDMEFNTSLFPLCCFIVSIVDHPMRAGLCAVGISRSTMCVTLSSISRTWKRISRRCRRRLRHDHLSKMERVKERHERHERNKRKRARRQKHKEMLFWRRLNKDDCCRQTSGYCGLPRITVASPSRAAVHASPRPRRRRCRRRRRRPPVHLSAPSLMFFF